MDYCVQMNLYLLFPLAREGFKDKVTFFNYSQEPWYYVNLNVRPQAVHTAAGRRLTTSQKRGGIALILGFLHWRPLL